MRTFERQTLRRQVVTIAGIALIPIALAIGWASNRTWLERKAEILHETTAAAATAAVHLDGVLLGLDTLAAALLHNPAVTALDKAEADRLFVSLLPGQPLLTNIALLTPAGEIRGSALPYDDGVIAAPWIGEMARTARPLVSEFVIGGLTRKPTVVLAYPVQDATSPLKGILALPVNLDELHRVFAGTPLMPGAVITVFDRSRRVLLRTGEGNAFIGHVEDAADATEQPGTAPRRDIDGIERLSGAATLARARWTLRVGVPTALLAGQLQPLWQRNAAFLTVVLVGSFTLVLWFSQVIAQQLKELRAVVGRIADGDLSPPSMRGSPNRELMELQDAVVTMAANLRETRSVLGQQVAQERRLNDTLQSLQLQIVRQERLAAVGHLAAGLAHEVNNPLQAIIGATELIEHQDGLAPEVCDELTFIKAQGSRAREIVRSLSRFTSQHVGPPSPVDLRDVIAEVMQLQSRDLEGATLAMSVVVGSTRKVHANFAELEQVALNFVRNAQHAVESARYGSDRGRIEVRLFDVGANVRLEVHDNGQGLSPDHEARLFQPFFTTKPVGQGTGLGLSVSYGIIHSYGGSIGYFRNEWGGATFFFEVPALEGVDPSAGAGDDQQALLRRRD